MATAGDRIRLQRLTHVRYAHEDLTSTRIFLKDFGMTEVHTEGDGTKDGDMIYFAGTGRDQYVFVAVKGPRDFLGGTYVVESRADLERAAKIEGASDIISINAPGGGEMVILKDPDNVPVNVMFGAQDKTSHPANMKLVVNYPEEKPRQGKFHRFTEQPAPVFKLGHYGLVVKNYERTYKWYSKHFNFKASDILQSPDKVDVAAFLHLDRGQEYVDHHTFFFSENSKRIGPHHCSFEVYDADTQAIGHQWLEKKGYKPCWGVGRHILGSQIFDYWFMPDGFMIEHYADGDLVNEDKPTEFEDASNEALAIWGPAVPDGFLD